MTHGFALLEPGAPLEEVDRPTSDPGPGQVRLRVAGCGLCHTDLGFAHAGVRTRHPLPLILGHEITGIVEAAGPGAESLLGVAVVVPAVLPCGVCDDCLAGASMICRHQVMPGNDVDGGFATHVTLPARGLCPVPGATADFDRPLGASGVTLRHLSVIADAASTAYNAVLRAEIRPGDLAVIVGLGGVGGYAAQLARLRGARVVGVDVSEHRRDAATRLGCRAAFDPRALSAKDLKSAMSAFAKDVGAPQTRWKVFECSGTASGQSTAFGLLVRGATLSVVGFTLDTVTLRLSNLMALDARAIGSWGCPVDHFPAIVELALSGALDVTSDSEIRPLSELPDAFRPGAPHGARLVFAPDRSPV